MGIKKYYATWPRSFSSSVCVLAQRLVGEKTRTWSQAGLSAFRPLAQNYWVYCILGTSNTVWPQLPFVCPLGQIPQNKKFQCLMVWDLWGVRIPQLVSLDRKRWSLTYLSRSLLKKQRKTQHGHGCRIQVSSHRRLGIQWVNFLPPWPLVLKVPFIINLKSLIGQKNSLLLYPKGRQHLIAGSLFVLAISV